MNQINPKRQQIEAPLLNSQYHSVYCNLKQDDELVKTPYRNSKIVQAAVRYLIGLTHIGEGRPMSVNMMIKILVEGGMPPAIAAKLPSQIRKGGALNLEWKEAFATRKFSQRLGRYPYTKLQKKELQEAQLRLKQAKTEQVSHPVSQAYETTITNHHPQQQQHHFVYHNKQSPPMLSSQTTEPLPAETCNPSHRFKRFNQNLGSRSIDAAHHPQTARLSMPQLTCLSELPPSLKLPSSSSLCDTLEATQTAPKRKTFPAVINNDHLSTYAPWAPSASSYDSPTSPKKQCRSTKLQISNEQYVPPFLSPPISFSTIEYKPLIDDHIYQQIDEDAVSDEFEFGASALLALASSKKKN